MNDWDAETRAAIEALVYRLRNRGDVDDERFAAGFVAAMRDRGWMPPLAPPAGEEGGTREAARELIAFACATRPDWTPDETWNAVHAAKTAGLPWEKLAPRLVVIALRTEEAPTRPGELWDHARGITSKTEGGPATEEFRGALAALKARNTGPMQRLRDDNDTRETA